MEAEFNVHEFNISRFNSDLLDIVFADSITLSDVIAKDIFKPLADSQFLQDNAIQKQPAKGFAETINIDDWITVKRDPAQSDWED